MKKKLSIILFLSFLCMIFLASRPNLSEAEKLPEEIEQTRFISYFNGRFSFNLHFPEIFEIQSTSDNNDGATFVSNEENAKLLVWGQHNIENDDGNSLLKKALNYRVSYLLDYHSAPEYYSITWTDNGGKDGHETLFHEYGIVKEGTIAAYQISYPIEKKEQFEYLFDKMSLTFWPENFDNALINTVAFSQALHYNNFSQENPPDSTTINLIFYNLVKEKIYLDQYPGKNNYDNKYYLSSGPEGEANSVFNKEEYTAPEDLYNMFFAYGKYQYPASSFKIAGGTQTGLEIKLVDIPYDIKTDILQEKNIDGQKIVDVFITRINKTTGETTKLGQAQIVLKEEPDTFLGYKIAGFKANYPAFNDVI